MKSFVTYNVPALSTWSEKLVPKLTDRAYRHAYMEEGVKAWIARQVRALREQRDWSQDDLARESGKKQSAISRIEDPDYGQLTLQTLFDLAKAYDLPLLVQFVEWQDRLYRMEDVSTEALRKEPFDGEHLAALSGQQYLASKESALTTYASSVGAAMIFSTDVDVFHSGSVGLGSIIRDFRWNIGDDDHVFLDAFYLGIENQEQPEDEPKSLEFDLDVAAEDYFGRTLPLNSPRVAGLIGHG